MCRVFLSLMFVASSVLAEEKTGLYDEDIPALQEASKAYISVHVDAKWQKVIADWNKKIKVVIETRMADSNITEDQACRDLAYDWLSDNARALEARNEEKILIACLWFDLLISKKFGLPARVKSEMTHYQALQLISFLKDQVSFLEVKR